VPVCEENGLAANGVANFAKVEGNTMIEDDAPEKLKHFSAHVAMLPQSSMAHGFALCGQQSSISSIVDMSVGAGDLGFTPALPAAGSIATDRAIRSARMVRPMRMDQAWTKIAAFPVLGSSDDFARYLTQVVRGQCVSS
jgi:hypothetical protein